MLCMHLKNNTRKIILMAILDCPGITGKELSSKLGLDKSTIYWHVSKLKDDNIIYTENDGRFKKYYLEKELMHSLDN
jgi:predicted transcriptional regulator